MEHRRRESWGKWSAACGAIVALAVAESWGTRLTAHDDDDGFRLDSARHVFERETFGGNGRTCLTCHSRGTGTVSPADAQDRFARNPNDPLFRGDGTDDGAGHGVTRMLSDATVLVRIPLADNVSLAADPAARSIVVRRGDRFQSVLVSELNAAANPVVDFVFKNPDGTTTAVSSPDPGRALITGSSALGESLNAFKIPTLWGVEQTAPYFHDNSAGTLEDVTSWRFSSCFSDSCGSRRH